MQKIEDNFVKSRQNSRFLMLALTSSILHLTCWSSEAFSFLQEKTLNNKLMKLLLSWQQERILQKFAGWSASEEIMHSGR